MRHTPGGYSRFGYNTSYLVATIAWAERHREGAGLVRFLKLRTDCNSLSIITTQVGVTAPCSLLTCEAGGGLHCPLDQLTSRAGQTVTATAALTLSVAPPGLNPERHRSPII